MPQVDPPVALCRREGPLELYKKVEQLQKHLLNKSLLEMFEAAASGRCLNSLLFG